LLLALRDGRTADASRFRVLIHINIIESDFVPTDGIRLPVERSGDFGTSPFFGQLSGKRNRLTAFKHYIVSVPMAMIAWDRMTISRCNNGKLA
jgi:hypothetical protein